VNQLLARSNDVNELAGIEQYLAETQRGQVVFNIDRILTQGEIMAIEDTIVSRGVTLTAPVIQSGNQLIVSFEKRIPPLVIIGGVVVAVVGGVLGWTVYQTVVAGVPLWVWVLGGAAVLYLVATSETGKTVGRTALKAGQAYLVTGGL
jgi:predicted tellurium resistance membrane protein TerC